MLAVRKISAFTIVVDVPQVDCCAYGKVVVNGINKFCIREIFF
jgi:hypothetical protein